MIDETIKEVAKEIKITQLRFAIDKLLSEARKQSMSEDFGEGYRYAIRVIEKFILDIENDK